MELIGSGKMRFFSHKNSVWIDIFKNTIDGLDCQFKDRNETIRVANLINQIE